MEINKQEQYVVFKPESGSFNDEVSSQIEKNIAGMYSAEGRINFIIDLSQVGSISEIGHKLFQKVQKICKNESGLFVLVTTNDDLIDDISGKGEEFLLVLPSLEEAIDVIFMNDLENDFKDDQEDEFGMEESDY